MRGTFIFHPITFLFDGIAHHSKKSTLVEAAKSTTIVLACFTSQKQRIYCAKYTLYIVTTEWQKLHNVVVNKQNKYSA